MRYAECRWKFCVIPAGSYHYPCSKLEPSFLWQKVSRKVCELFACLPFIKPARVIWIRPLKLTHARCLLITVTSVHIKYARISHERNLCSTDQFSTKQFRAYFLSVSLSFSSYFISNTDTLDTDICILPKQTHLTLSYSLTFYVFHPYGLRFRL